MTSTEKEILIKAYPQAKDLIEEFSVNATFDHIAHQLKKSETNPIYFVNCDKTFFNNKVYLGTRKIKSMT